MTKPIICDEISSQNASVDLCTKIGDLHAHTLNNLRHSPLTCRFHKLCCDSWVI